MNRNMKLLIAALIGLIVLSFMLSGCGGSGNDAQAKINLMLDENEDGLPDELVDAVNKLVDIAKQSGDPDSIDTPEEEEAFKSALTLLLERLPYSDKTNTLLLEIKDLYEQIANSGGNIEKINALQQNVEEKLAEIRRDDINYSIVQDAVATMFDSQKARVSSLPGKASDEVRRPDYDSLQRGDILFGKSSGMLSYLAYVVDFTHAGNYNGNSTVYEAVDAGVIIRPLSEWKTSYSRVALGRSNKKTPAEIAAAMDWALGRYKSDGSTLYNFNVFRPHLKQVDYYYITTPLTPLPINCLYCSQLTWKIHDHVGVNVDSNNPKYLAQASLKYLRYGGFLAPGGLAYLWGIIVPGVMPDEIFRDSDISVYSDGNNLDLTPITAPTEVYRLNQKMERDSNFYNPSLINYIQINGARAPKGEPLDYYATLYYYDNNGQRKVGAPGQWHPTQLIAFQTNLEWFANYTMFEVTVKARLKSDHASESEEYTQMFPVWGKPPLPPLSIVVTDSKGSTISDKVIAGKTNMFMAIGARNPLYNPLSYQYGIDYYRDGEWKHARGGETRVGSDPYGSKDNSAILFESDWVPDKKEIGRPEKVRATITVWDSLFPSLQSKKITQEFEVVNP